MFFRLDPTSILLLDQKLRLEKPLPLFQTFARLPPFSQTSPNFQPPLMPSTPSPCPPTPNPLMVFDSLYFFLRLCQVWKIHYPFTHPSIPGVSHFPPVFRFHPFYLSVRLSPLPSTYPSKHDPSGSTRSPVGHLGQAVMGKPSATRQGLLGQAVGTSYGQAVSGLGRAVYPSRASRIRRAVGDRASRIRRAVKDKTPRLLWGLADRTPLGIRRCGFACIRLCGLLLRRCLDTSRRE